MTEVLAGTNFKRVDELPLDEWIFHLSMAYCATLADADWQAHIAELRQELPSGQTELISGVFALANGLARDGVRSEEEHQLRRRSNDWFEAAYPEPTLTSPAVYDRSVNPGAVAWFKLSAVDLIEKTTLYTGLLDAQTAAVGDRYSCRATVASSALALYDSRRRSFSPASLFSSG